MALFNKEMEENSVAILNMTNDEYIEWYEGLKQQIRDAAKAEDDLTDSTDDLKDSFTGFTSAISGVELDKFIAKIEKANSKLEIEILGKTTDVFSEMKKIFDVNLSEGIGFTNLIYLNSMIVLIL